MERSRAFDVRVVAIADEAAGVRSFELVMMGDRALPSWSPGAHIDVLMPGMERQFSLCGAPDAETWRIGVLNEPAGRGGSAWMHERVSVGDVLRVRGPRNNFPLVD